jgi:AraC-like DNA-binding protein
MNWLYYVQKSINFIEENLLNEICVDISEHIHLSKDYFQKIFRIVTGYTAGEYMRNRRLSLAARDIAETKMKIIDIAYKYMYESPESFTKSFSRLYSFSPSYMRKHKITPDYFAPLTIQTNIKGGFNMNKVFETNDPKLSALHEIVLTLNATNAMVAQNAENTRVAMQLIKFALEDAENIAELAKKSAKELEQLSKLVIELSAANDEQANGVRQVNAALLTMEKVFQEKTAE